MSAIVESVRAGMRSRYRSGSTPTPLRWLVHAEAPGYHGEAVHATLALIGECLVERGVSDAAARVNGRTARRMA